MDKITNNENLLAYDITSKDLMFSDNTEILGFELREKILKYTNIGEVLSFELKSYHPSMPIYAIILDFMFETGGVY